MNEKNILKKDQGALKSFLLILALFIGWRLALSAVAIISYHKIPHAETFRLINSLHPFWSFWCNYDAAYFTDIAQNGYGSASAAFFPGFPIIIFLFSHIFSFISIKILAVVLANIFTFLAVWQVYRYAKLTTQNEDIALETAVFMLCFPFSLFLALGYSEPLFLLAAISSFYCLRKERYIAAGLWGALASMTRLVGAVLIPALLVEAIIVAIKKKKLMPLAVLLSSFGTIFVSVYFKLRHGDWLMWLHSYGPETWNRKFGTGAFIEIQKNFETIIHGNFYKTDGPLISTIALLSILFVAVGLILLLVQKRWAEAVFVFGGAMIPLLSGSLVSFNRYAISLFPLYLAFSCYTYKWRYFIPLLLLPLVGIFVSMFAVGWWVG